MSLRPTALVPARELTRATWAARLARFANSTLTVAAFCDREAVSVPAFYYWKRRLHAARPATVADPVPLLPVRLTAGPTPVELLLPGGAILRLSPGCDLDFVRALLATLGATPC
jgi:transposase